MSLSCAAHSQQTTLSGQPAIADEQNTLFDELPSVFTASRHDQPVTKAPASVDIITAQQIKRYGWRTVAAMLGSLPGFLSTYDRAYNHVGVRGFAPPGDYNTRILVMIDGHRVNESLQDYAGLGRDFLVDVENIERVEVVRGPASALYGSSAFFAVVNVITQRGRDLQGTRLAFDGASYGSFQGQVSHGKKYSNGMETLLSASAYDSQGHDRLSYPGLGTVANQDAERVERLSGKLGWGDFTLSGSWVGRKKFLPTGTTGAAFGEPNAYYNDKRAYADLNYRHNFSGDWDFTGRLFWDSYEFDDDLPYRNGSSQRVINQDHWQGQWFGSEALLSHTFFDSHRLTLGSEVRQNYLQRMTNQDESPFVQYADNNLSSTIYGFFLQDEWAITNALQLQAGGRFDHYDSFGGTFNPRLGLVFQALADTTVKLLYGSAFRAPNAFESYYQCCQNSTPWIGNSRLKPEGIETYELVLEQRLNEEFNLRISPFYNRLTDIIALEVMPSGIRQFHNHGNADVHGLETQLQARYGDFEGRLSHTFQESYFSGSESANSPSQMIKFNTTAPLWADKLFIGLEVQYVSQRITVARRTVEGYAIANVNLFSRQLLPGLELSGGLYNIFDTLYSDPASPPLLPDSISQDGRNFRLRASLEF
ncbi:catecholate siderophore receptor CirA [Methylosoma difficile]